jgi:hypothetical protein
LLLLFCVDCEKKERVGSYILTMKYGDHLKNNIAPEYGPEPYLDYKRLDNIISELSRLKPSRYVWKWVWSFCVFGIHSLYCRGLVWFGLSF